MILIGYAIWIGIAVFFCRLLAIGGEKRSKGRNIFCTTLAMVLILLPYWDVILGAPAMHSLCTEQAGVRKYEPAKFPLPSVLVSSEDARSLCFPCYAILIRGLAVETQADIKLTLYSDATALTNQSGFMKYWLAHIGNPDCKSFEAAFPSERSRRDLWQLAGTPYDERSCIASLAIKVPSAAFRLTYPTFKTIWDGVLVVRARTVELRRANQKRPLATLKYIEQLPWNGRLFGMHEWLPPVPDCPSFVRPVTSTNFAPELLLELLAGQLQQGEVFK